MTSIKLCPDCGKSKPITEFNYNNREKQKYQSYCRPCERKRNIIFASNNREQELERKRKYYQDNRERLLKYKKENYKATRPQKLLIAKNYRAANSETVKEKYATYAAKNKELLRHHAQLRKIRKKTNGIYSVTVKEEKKLYSQPCFYCGSFQSIQLDHVVPLSRGGTHSIGNLVPACMTCNTQKNKWFITEWKNLKRKWGNNA